MSHSTPRIIIAADGLSYRHCMQLAGVVSGRVYAIKIHELFDRHGPKAVRALRNLGVRVWVDAKIHDTPDTARLRAQAMATAGADILTVHAAGGIEMMCAAVEKATEVYAVTVLTSLEESWVRAVYGRSATDVVLAFALLARHAGVRGIVCSPREVGMLATHPELCTLELVTPGVRSSGTPANDQQRIATPAAAIAAGATRIVVGRQVTRANDPLTALTCIEEEIATALAAEALYVP